MGSGSYGQVYRTKFKLTDEIYAMKTLDKEFITKVKQQFYFLIKIRIESENEESDKGERNTHEH